MFETLQCLNCGVTTASGQSCTCGWVTVSVTPTTSPPLILPSGSLTPDDDLLGTVWAVESRHSPPMPWVVLGTFWTREEAVDYVNCRLDGYPYRIVQVWVP